MLNATKIVLKPVITEKALLDASKGEYTFEVYKTANKDQIAKAVSELFKVDVKQVKTRIVKNRTRRVMRHREETKLSSFKKATVKIGKEQKIDIFEVGGNN
ncbi:MAG TPA: 50S ribosomal protein L23 [Candidatus Saccharimonadales bacterium]|nr:50S ribosomal protein L23 [Candidatus Saccharimonadales bacterium]